MYCNKHNVGTINYDEKGRDITNRVLKPMHRAFYNNKLQQYCNITRMLCAI